MLVLTRKVRPDQRYAKTIVGDGVLTVTAVRPGHIRGTYTVGESTRVFRLGLREELSLAPGVSICLQRVTPGDNNTGGDARIGFVVDRDIVITRAELIE